MNIEKLKAILIDDEAAAREVLLNLLTRFCPDVEVIGEANGLVNGVQIIKENKPDVVFLDIQMPNYAGYEIVDLIDNIDFNIIFITAYDQYALKAFEISALDYILKPIDIDRLVNAVEKVKEKSKLTSAHEQYQLLNKTIKSDKASKIAIFERGERQFIEINEVLALEGQSSYCKIHLKDGTSRVLSKNLKTTSSYLEGWDNFFRCHKSWVVNLDSLVSFSKSKLEIKLQNDLIVKLSRNKTREIDSLLNQ